MEQRGFIEYVSQLFQNLQVDYIDYYLLHSVGNASQDADGYHTFKKRYIDNGVLDFCWKKGKQEGYATWDFHFMEM